MSRIDPIILNQAQNTSGVKHKLTVKFPQPQNFNNQRIALAYAGLYYSWRNVSSYRTKSGLDGWNNDKFSYIWVDGTTYNVTLPEGFYAIPDINDYLQRYVMKPNGHFVLDADDKAVYFIQIESNATYYSVTATMSPIAVPVGGSNPNSLSLGEVPQLVIPNENDFGKLLGIDPGTYPSAAGTTDAYYLNSQNVPNISPVTTVNINCNLSQSKTSIFTNTIHQFSPTVAVNQYIAIQPPFLVYFDVSGGTYNDITVYFTDQEGRPLDIIDPNITVTLLLETK
jgi:hypothetical protein